MRTTLIATLIANVLQSTVTIPSASEHGNVYMRIIHQPVVIIVPMMMVRKICLYFFFVFCSKIDPLVVTEFSSFFFGLFFWSVVFVLFVILLYILLTGFTSTRNSECGSHLCKGNYDITSGGKQFEEGRCTYRNGHLTGGTECWEDAECATPTTCKGNNAGICTDTITAGGCSRGICQRPANSLGGGSTDCLEDDECQSPHVCIGNNGGVCAGGDCEYGICQRPHHSLSGGATCLKDNECRSPATCIGNNGGVVVPGSQPIEGVCQHTDNSLNHGSNCLKNDECQHICDGHDSDCDGVCIGTS